MKKILYVDMDNVLVDFETGLSHYRQAIIDEYEGRYDEIPGIFNKMQPINDAIDSFALLSRYFDTYVLSTSPWENPSAWSDKLLWIKQYLGKFAYKRLILTHHKNLNIGDYLIDDRIKNGVDQFPGTLIHFGSKKFPDWKSVLHYLIPDKI
jgi:5'(3')-deoxyribonucleotidase